MVEGRTVGKRKHIRSWDCLSAIGKSCTVHINNVTYWRIFSYSTLRLCKEFPGRSVDTTLPLLQECAACRHNKNMTHSISACSAACGTKIDKPIFLVLNTGVGRHCATSRKVPGARPDDVNFFMTFFY
jgi:hypothetical protein